MTHLPMIWRRSPLRNTLQRKRRNNAMSASSSIAKKCAILDDRPRRQNQRKPAIDLPGQGLPTTKNPAEAGFFNTFSFRS